MTGTNILSAALGCWYFAWAAALAYADMFVGAEDR
jgi:hypothetical protein